MPSVMCCSGVARSGIGDKEHVGDSITFRSINKFSLYETFFFFLAFTNWILQNGELDPLPGMQFFPPKSTLDDGMPF